MAASPFSLEGKVAIVTGGGVGIGKSIAIEFARAGADVAIASRKIEHLEPVTAEIRKLGRRSFALAVDVRQEDQVKGLVEKTVKDLGKLDVMVNNAGASFRAKVEDISVNGWNTVVGINLNGVFFGCKWAGRQMMAQGGGVIINISSIAGVYGSASTASRRVRWRRRGTWTCFTRPIRTPRRSMTAWPTASASAAGARWRRSPTPASSLPPTRPAS
jgi:NAD(P)-dependent dehydrogenase (short-subunit alcohol dehydrogenase family)